MVIRWNYNNEWPPYIVLSDICRIHVTCFTCDDDYDAVDYNTYDFLVALDKLKMLMDIGVTY